MSRYCIACDDLAHGREPSRPHQGCAEVGKNGAASAPSASPATPDLLKVARARAYEAAREEIAAPASPATEDEALVRDLAGWKYADGQAFTHADPDLDSPAASRARAAARRGRAADEGAGVPEVRPGCDSKKED